MVEFAVAVQSPQDLCVAGEPWTPFPRLNPIEAELQALFFEQWRNVFGEPARPERIHFGSEFCQYRLVPLPVVKKALQYSWQNGLEFTFATPFMHNEKFHQLTGILSYLEEAAFTTGKRIEVVVNDWGVFHHIRTHCPHLDIVLGRLLNKTIRDPRVAHYYDDPKAPEQARNYFRDTGLLSVWFSKFLENSNVVGLEFDELIQGLCDLEPKTMRASFHYPFGCVASGSACMVGFMETEKSQKFRGDPQCKQQCQLYVFELKNRRHTDMQQRVFQKGTTAFYAHTPELVRNGLDRIRKMSRPRVVYSPKLPL